MILDWDFHHGNVNFFVLSSYLISYNILGNGSQDIWYADERVLYISLHRWTLLLSYLYLFRWLRYIFSGMESMRKRRSTPVVILERVTRLERNQQWGTTSTLVRSLYTAVLKCSTSLYINTRAFDGEEIEDTDYNLAFKAALLVIKVRYVKMLLLLFY